MLLAGCEKLGLGGPRKPPAFFNDLPGAKQALESALDDRFFVFRVPYGNLEIHPDGAGPYGNDYAHGRFPESFLRNLKELERQELLVITVPEGQTNEESGEQVIAATPTEHAKQAADPKLSTRTYITIRTGSCNITEVSQHTQTALPNGGQERLLMGAFHYKPNSFYKAFVRKAQSRDIKFRATIDTFPDGSTQVQKIELSDPLRDPWLAPFSSD